MNKKKLEMFKKEAKVFPTVLVYASVVIKYFNRHIY